MIIKTDIPRNVILIGGILDNDTTGVSIDMFNTEQYLSSPTGGAFNRHEIQNLYDPSTQKLYQILSAVRSLYSIVMFFGHGMNYQGMDYVLIGKQNGRYNWLPVNRLTTNAKKQLIVVDACRTITHERPGLGDHFKSFKSNLSHVAARGLFNQYLSLCPDGIVLIQSCDTNQSANAKGSEGGAFTQSLLDVSNMWSKKETNYPILTIGHAFNFAASHLYCHHMIHPSEQHPRLRQSRDLQYPVYPFALTDNIQNQRLYY